MFGFLSCRVVVIGLLNELKYERGLEEVLLRKLLILVIIIIVGVGSSNNIVVF